jgi:hypothetical protein
MKVGLIARLLGLALALGSLPALGVDEPQNPEPQPQGVERTPPRLSFTDGKVSFWRPGAEDWSPAQVNTPLAPGDVLYTGAGANLELQIGTRAFVRAGADTQLGLDNQEPDFLQFRMTAGHVSFDLRSLATGHTIELDTPNAVFSIERSGYYRIDIANDTTTFTTRRGGRATMTPAAGEPASIAPSEELVVTGTETARLETYVAPEPDAWDRWNYDRTDQIIDAMSQRYVPSGVYGADSLDHYGNWRIVPPYGPVWVPDGVPTGWAPYTTGRWIWDPYYGWTWVDYAPWGWAPYHYGRWVYVNNFWGWAPGPVVAPVYAPALVAFFGGGSVSVGVGVGFPDVGWVALGWGEPVIPWWGSVGFVGRPCWRGWGGPHVVNNVVVNRTTIVNAKDVNVFRNAGVRDAVVVVPRDRFGHGPIGRARLRNVDAHRLDPIRGTLPIKPRAGSLVPATGHTPRPPELVQRRRVLATREPSNPAASLQAEGLKVPPNTIASPPQLVAAPRRPHSAPESPRPPFGTESAPERRRPPLPPRFQESMRPAGASLGGPRPAGSGHVARRVPGGAGTASAPVQQAAPAPAGGIQAAPVPAQPAPAAAASEPRARERRVPAPGPAAPPAPASHAPVAGAAPAQVSPPAQRSLPGEPANRLFPGRAGSSPPGTGQHVAPSRPSHSPHNFGGARQQGRPNHSRER